MFSRSQGHDNTLPHKVYVGLTRAKEKLFIFSKINEEYENKKDPSLLFRYIPFFM